MLAYAYNGQKLQNYFVLKCNKCKKEIYKSNWLKLNISDIILKFVHK